MQTTIQIGDKTIGEGQPCFVIAEMSGNHNMDFNRAVEIVHAAKDAGADAIKLQTYTADTITLNSHKDCFRTGDDSLWSGMTLYELYQKAYTPWDWQPKLKKIADELGIILFSSPFDLTAVDFLEQMDVPAYKIASFEINDIPLVRKIARTGKPVIISTGIADLGDISLALETCKEAGNDKIVLLKCTSEYPAPYNEMNLRMIPNMRDTFQCVSGISDHSLGDEISIAAVALGAKVVEKHFTLSRKDGGVDSAFSMEIEEMRQMVEKIRHVEAAMGKVSYELDEKQKNAKKGSRSLFASADIKKGDVFTEDNVKSVRPGCGLPTKYADIIMGKRATHDIEFAEPLKLEDVQW
jgi:pseudaminic acid synthase